MRFIAMLPRRIVPALFCVAGLLWATGLARAGESARVWRVCVPATVIPPYTSNDPKRPGTVERLIVDAGRAAGLSVILLRLPSRRCRAMLETGDADATLSAPVPANLAQLQYPMKAGAIDASKRVARLDMVWVKRPESPLAWDGEVMNGAPKASLVVGTRNGVMATITPLEARGFKVDSAAATAQQVFQKLAARRIDLAVTFLEEAEVALSDPALHHLVVMPKALSRSDFYASVRKQLPDDMQAMVEAWWAAIGRMRELPQYRLAPE